jgi:putative thioredoxin
MLAASVGRFAARASAAVRYYSSQSKYSFDVTDATFQKEVLDASHKTPIVLDCWADWCRPCKMLAPVLEQAVGEHQGAVLLAKMSVTENHSVPVEAIPAVFGYSKGKVINQFVGGQPSTKVKEFVQELLTAHAKAK